MTRLGLSVEIHDVSPASEPEVRWMRWRLLRLGVNRPALLVVPCWQDARGRRWDLRSSPWFAEWLRREQEAGAQIVQHGLTHRAPDPPPPGLVNAFYHHAFSRGCAEFAHLNFAQASERLQRGRHILAACGLHAEGFVAPAWLQSPEALAAVWAEGFSFTAFLHKVVWFGARGAESVPSPALTFDAAHPAIDYGKRVVMRAIEERGREATLVRVALHPADLRGARPVEHILTRIRELLRTRVQVTYPDWRETWRRAA
ncbi:MAG: DUF2334 domain-containing protein [Myxococcales bacterium]|nr:DUF2334 domain-containing protein [Myxococcales bacterium]